MYFKVAVLVGILAAAKAGFLNSPSRNSAAPSTFASSPYSSYGGSNYFLPSSQVSNYRPTLYNPPAARNSYSSSAYPNSVGPVFSRAAEGISRPSYSNSGAQGLPTAFLRNALTPRPVVENTESSYSSTPYYNSAINYAAPGRQPLAYSAQPAYSAQLAYSAQPANGAQSDYNSPSMRVNEYDPNPQYTFAYNVQDSITGDSKTQHEERNGDAVRGSYSLVEPDGSRRIVEYTADSQNGFNAVVSREPINHPSSAPAGPVPVVAYATPSYTSSGSNYGSSGVGYQGSAYGSSYGSTSGGY